MPDDGENAWDCDHHPEWADKHNRCHHPDHAPGGSEPPNGLTEADVVIIGPECIASADGEAICWRGENYYRRNHYAAALEGAREDGWDEGARWASTQPAIHSVHGRVVGNPYRAARLGVHGPTERS